MNPNLNRLHRQPGGDARACGRIASPHFTKLTA